MVDITKVKEDLIAEKAKKDNEQSKVSELEKELQRYRDAEAAAKLEAEKAKEESIKKELEALKAENEAIKTSFEEKLEKISQRTTTVKGGEGAETLSMEDYLKDREKYDTMVLKEDLGGKGVFN